jgi:hypothetical protein
MKTKPVSQTERTSGSLDQDGSAARLRHAIEDATREAVNTLNNLGSDQTNRRKLRVIERAIQSVLVVQQNAAGERPGGKPQTSI